MNKNTIVSQINVSTLRERRDAIMLVLAILKKISHTEEEYLNVLSDSVQDEGESRLAEEAIAAIDDAVYTLLCAYA
jgi:hypothetical protein